MPRLRMHPRNRRNGATRGHARVAGAILALALASPATAVLIDNGNSMIDTATNLEWLDLTETLGLSWNQAEASPFVTVDGYVHATNAQVVDLFLDAGFVAIDGIRNPANDPAAATLLSFLGCTQFCGTVSPLGQGFADFTGNLVSRPLYRATPTGAYAVEPGALTSNLNLVDTTSGHYLVRVVPEPTTALLLGLGLAALGVRGRLEGAPPAPLRRG